MARQLLDTFMLGGTRSPSVCQASSPSSPPLRSQPSTRSSKLRFPEHRILSGYLIQPPGGYVIKLIYGLISWNLSNAQAPDHCSLSSRNILTPGHINTVLGPGKTGLRRQYPRPYRKAPFTFLEWPSNAYFTYNSDLNQDLNLSQLKLQDRGGRVQGGGERDEE